MKKLVILSVAIVLLVAIGTFWWLQTAQAAIGTLNLYDGSATITAGTKSNAGTNGSLLHTGDVIRTSAGTHSSIILNDGTVIRLEADSEIEVGALKYDGGQISNASFKLHFGQLWTVVKPIKAGGSYAIETPTLVATVRGTSFYLSYLNGISKLLVADGVVQANLKSSATNKRNLSPGQSISIRDAFQTEDFNNSASPASDEQPISSWLHTGSLTQEPSGTSDQTTTTPTSTPPLPSKTPQLPPFLSPLAPAPTSKPPQQPPVTSLPAPVPPAAKKLVSLLLLPKTGSIKIGSSIQFNATGQYSDNSLADVTNQVIWTQQPSLGTLFNTGTFQANASGQTTIQANLAGIVSNTSFVTVQAAAQSAPQLSSIRVSYVKQQPLGAVGGFPTAQFTATAIYSDGSSADVTANSTWSIISGNAKGSISPSGYYTAQSQGADVVRGSYGGQSAEVTINIP